jgi:hypothetical protein
MLHIAISSPNIITKPAQKKRFDIQLFSKFFFIQTTSKERFGTKIPIMNYTI